MTSRFIPTKPIHNAGVKRPVSVRVFVWLAIVAVIGTLICSGFVISARQHFEAVSVGYKSEELRQQEQQLSEKVRRLELERNRITSPIEMEQRAFKLGLVRPLAKKAEIRRPIN
ncbi:MAG: cell division protein FtsL [Acidobacteria bacterium]|nr:cell division protein FtsL [Acidobacteriota bacterium]